MAEWDWKLILWGIQGHSWNEHDIIITTFNTFIFLSKHMILKNTLSR